MKKLLRLFYSAALAAAAIAANGAPSRAQAVFCTNCASEVTQLLNLARLVDQVATQGNILNTGNNQLQNMTVNTTPYASLQWSNGGSNLTSINSILSGNGGLTFTNGNVSSLFGSQYGTYNSYLGTPPTSAAFAGKYQQWSSNTNSSVQTTLQAGAAQSNAMTGPEQTQISYLQGQTQNAQGNLQALQTVAQVGLLNVQQMQALRQLILMQSSLDANSIQTSSDQLASQQAAWRSFISPSTNIPTSGGQRF